MHIRTSSTLMHTNTACTPAKHTTSHNALQTKQIGEGSFGKVFMGLNEKTGELFAVKQISLMDGSQDEVCGVSSQLLLHTSSLLRVSVVIGAVSFAISVSSDQSATAFKGVRGYTVQSCTVLSTAVLSVLRPW
jgi:serine/threonine protein kinase